MHDTVMVPRNSGGGPSARRSLADDELADRGGSQPGPAGLAVAGPG